MNTHQYFCKKCGYEREGQLDHPAGIGGYSWACPQCKSHDIDSREVIMTKDQLTKLITEVLGERCPEHHEQCMTCAAWWMFDRLSDEPTARHTDHSIPCPTCGSYELPEGRAEKSRHRT